MFNYEYKYLNLIVSIFLSISITTRLSNLIFLLVVVLYQFIDRKSFLSTFNILFFTLFISSFVYYIFYSNLYSFYQSEEIYNNWYELTCLLNLTNTDHTIVGRLGRYVLKQVPFFGTVGTVILIGNFF